MLKNYSKENYSSITEFEKAVVDKCYCSFIPHKATYRDRTVNIVSFVFGDVNFGAEAKRVLKVMVELEPNNIAKLVFNLAVNSGTLKLNKEDMCAYEEINSQLLIMEEELKKEAAEREEQIRQTLIANYKKQIEEQKLLEKQKEEQKFQRRIDKALKKLETLEPEDTSKLFNEPQTLYEVIGWMAKHATGVRAAMPDYMEKWFVGKFGDVDRYVVNSKKKTSGGFDYQWGLGLKITFDKEVAGILEQRATSQNKKVIDNVAFVWDLIENYGFQFGKTQDIEKIRLEVPKQYVSDFEKGLAM